jgi:predicted DNA-binding transcriptional regulator AlpA
MSLSIDKTVAAADGTRYSLTLEELPPLKVTLLSRRQVAKALGLNIRAVAVMVQRGILPPPAYLNRHAARWPASEVEGALEKLLAERHREPALA